MILTSAQSTQNNPPDGTGLHIGVFDSGLGGLSVLRAIHHHLPSAHLMYVADSAHAPYGERDEAFIIRRSAIIGDFLVSQGAQILVVACNTATAAAVATLRQHLAALPVVGVEPGVKPAVALSRNHRIGVLATPRTLDSNKFQHLVQNHSNNAELVLQACPGLAKEIERGALDSPHLRALIKQFCEPLRQAQVDTVVLGCTHYPFVIPLIQQEMGDSVHLVDTAEAVARHTARIAAKLECENKASPTPSIQLWTSGQASHLSAVAQNWLQWPLHAESLPLDVA
ncbi:MAG: glutamate racemase [Burkholderiales bacterium]|nr:glutamate racemase [Burkholderiales bacterium]